ncbi:P-loop containing nucleoside triphosphate hydrolase protein [Microdochium trichocladiopsis]|uniref:P-loop containing nucleoside triphosphate hydrolase protein n=1 Tax=Microdochium trichocladiopsis TaxID=1682393 RepID=A0A9P9BR54_9PEZI|nr:P-loop containing nucleoside triphosphate hydrolase protein [Microdochium trichocladiopsis]KAH7026562.1 P-loop containing nucleoside triphosphate hydrolase protein [Microdochium trichocladiopsis]
MPNHISKPKKPKSKRTPTRLRHKIEKASASKQRKARKEAKKNPQWKSKLKKDPGIPNLFPYKEKILHEIEEGRRRKQEEQQRRREALKAGKTGGAATTEEDDAVLEDGAELEDFEGDDNMMDEDDVDESNPMAALIASAKKAAKKYDRELQSGDEDDEMDDSEDESEDDEDDEEGVSLPNAGSSRKAYDKVFKQVVDQADVVLYVVDARDPESTRSREVERMVMAAASGGKRLMLILNKVDLVPPKVLKDWLVYLRRYFPTLPLRASGSAPNAQTFNHKDLTVQSTSSALFKSLKSFAASKQLKRAISVGVIGYPNVGKSSVINALLARLGSRGASACPAGAEAGVTTSIRAVKIDKQLTLLDSPGIVFPSAPEGGLVARKNVIEAHAHLVLLNAVPPKEIDDPVPAVTLLLKRLSASPELIQKLMDVYDLPPLLSTSNGDATTDFLVQVARKRGRLSRGGVPNIHAAAMTVVTDWRDGRIQGWVDAPILPVAVEGAAPPKEGEALPDQKQIVTEWAKEFKLEGLWGDDSATADEMEQ